MDAHHSAEEDGAPCYDSPVFLQSAPVLPQSAQYREVVEPRNEVAKLTRRIMTYTHWKGKKSALQLSTAGFVYTGIGDKVECESCGIRLYNWQDDEDPIQAHKKYAPDCSFMLTRFPHIRAPPKPKKTMSIKYLQYADYQSRLDSFKDWPLKCVAQTPEMMAKSGFFYIGSADRARCFHCGVTLRDWDTDDYPPCAHIQWSQHCPFVQQLDIDELKREIEDAERRLEKAQHKLHNSQFFDCISRLIDDIVADCDQGVTSPVSNRDGSYTVSPAILAVIEMGYTEEVINKAIEVRRQGGCSDPDAMSILETILDMGD